MLFINLKVKITDVSSTNAEIGSCVKFRGLNRTKTIEFPTVSVPAPYGYLAELTEMKDEAVFVLLPGLSKQRLAFLFDFHLLEAFWRLVFPHEENMGRCGAMSVRSL